MGGGDLNLKKSWHPHTMKNQEKVWKAEQAKTQEENKLKDLRREIEEEKSREELKRIGRDSGVLGGSNEGDKKLDWMYKSSTDLINRDEYLLGRKIDKSFEVLQAEEQQKEKQNLVGVKQPINHVEHECVPFSIRSYKNLQNSEQVDLQRKVMEDPLMLIKQREMESRRKILENPVKLKELHRILKTDEKLHKVSKKSKKVKKSKKSKRKHQKRDKSTDSSASESENDSDLDLDSKLAKKLKGGLLDKEEALNMGLNLSKLLDSKYEKISQELDKAAGKSKKPKNIKLKNFTTDSDASSDVERKVRKRRSISKNRQIVGQPHKETRYRSLSRDRYIKKELYQERISRSPLQRTNYDKKRRIFNNPFKRNSRSLSRSRDERDFKGYQNRFDIVDRKTRVSNSRFRDDISRNRPTNISRSRDHIRDNRPKPRSTSQTRGYRNSHKINSPSRSRSNNRPKNPFKRSRSRDRNKTNKQASRSYSPPRDNRKTDRRILKSPSRDSKKLYKRISKSPSRLIDIRKPYQRILKSPSRSRDSKKPYKYISKSPSRSADSRKLYKRISRSRSHSRSPKSPSRSGDNRKLYKPISRTRSHSRSPKRSTRSPTKSQKSYKQPSSKSFNSYAQRTAKLSENEKQAKLREMMSNAAWREEERTEVVRKHREAYAREEERNKAREFDKDFLNKEVKKAMANQTSVGSRLRANLNNIQRTSAAMNSNFARK